MRKKEKNHSSNRLNAFLGRLKVCYKVFTNKKFIFVAVSNLKDEKSKLGVSVAIFDIKNLQAAEIFAELGKNALERAAREN